MAGPDAARGGGAPRGGDPRPGRRRPRSAARPRARRVRRRRIAARRAARPRRRRLGPRHRRATAARSSSCSPAPSTRTGSGPWPCGGTARCSRSRPSGSSTTTPTTGGPTGWSSATTSSAGPRAPRLHGQRASPGAAASHRRRRRSRRGRSSTRSTGSRDLEAGAPPRRRRPAGAVPRGRAADGPRRPPRGDARPRRSSRPRSRRSRAQRRAGRPRVRRARRRRAVAAARGAAAVGRAARSRPTPACWRSSSRSSRRSAASPQNKVPGEDLWDHTLRTVDAAPADAAGSSASPRCSTTSASRRRSPTAASTTTTSSGPSRPRRSSAGCGSRGPRSRTSPTSSATTCSRSTRTPSGRGRPPVHPARSVATHVDALFELRRADDIGSGLAPDDPATARVPRPGRRRARGRGRRSTGRALAVDGDDLIRDLGLEPGPQARPDARRAARAGHRRPGAQRPGARCCCSHRACLPTCRTTRSARDRAPAPGRAGARRSGSSTRPSGCTARSPTRIPRNSIAVVGLARVALERADDAEAYRQARRALAIDPENVAARRLADRWRRSSRSAARRSPRSTPSSSRPPAASRRSRPRSSSAPGLVDRLLRREPPVKVLVTGGAGYVGGVSVDALLAAGHDVVVLDDLTTGHRAIVHGGARLVVGSYGDPAVVGPLLEARAHRRHPPLRRALAGRREHPRPGAATTATTSPAASPCSRRRAAAGVGAVVFSSTAAVYGVPGRDADRGGRAAPADQPVRRDEAHARGGAALVRGGVRAAERRACATSTSPARPSGSARCTGPRRT